MPTPIESITSAFYNCVDRGCTKQQLTGFIDRERQRWSHDPEMMQLLDNLESQI